MDKCRYFPFYGSALGDALRLAADGLKIAFKSVIGWEL
jgi:hypothetical protein